MSAALQRHPDSRGGETLAVAVEISRPSPGALRLGYRVSGGVGELRLPPAAAPERADELWRTTCFEVFIRRPGGGCYEFNFAPSTRWAAYSFEDYRAGMAVAGAVARPRIRAEDDPARFQLEVELDLCGLSDLPPRDVWRLGASAVIEDENGRLSYWALAHPPGKPDFHHPDSFALDLAVTEPR